MEGDEDVTTALDAADTALDAISARDDTRSKFKAYSELADGLRVRADKASAGRRDVAVRIREDEKLKLRPLADELGISTTRLHQLIHPEKKDRTKEQADVRADDDLG